MFLLLTDRIQGVPDIPPPQPNTGSQAGAGGAGGAGAIPDLMQQLMAAMAGGGGGGRAGAAGIDMSGMGGTYFRLCLRVRAIHLQSIVARSSDVLFAICDGVFRGRRLTLLYLACCEYTNFLYTTPSATATSKHPAPSKIRPCLHVY